MRGLSPYRLAAVRLSFSFIIFMIKTPITQSNAVEPDFIALIPAAGVGSRMGAVQPKQYLKIANRSVLEHALDAFLRHPRIKRVVLVVSADDAYIDQLGLNHAKLAILRCGGATRKETVLNGLRQLQSSVREPDWILVHDAARPGITTELVSKLIDELQHHEVGGLLAMPVVDTVKRWQAGQLDTVDRSDLWLAQTPQMFRFRDLFRALTQVQHVTDESSAIEALGLVPKLVEGHSRNLKITTPADLLLATHYLGKI